MTTRGVTLAALLATLGRPSWWLLGIAGFLVRGGIVVFLVAIVSLPSPLVLSNILGPLVLPLALGRLVPETAALIGAGIGLLLAWLVIGGWFAAATEITLIDEARRAGHDEGLPTRPVRTDDRWLIGRATAAHLFAHLPTLAALGLVTVEIVGVTYRELTNPSDSGPIALRVIAASAIPIAIVVGLWLAGEIVGGLAVRRIVLDRASVAGSVVGAVGDLVRRPAGALLMPLATSAVLALDLGAVLAVVAVVWTEVRERLVHPLADPLATALTVATFGAAWSLALIVTGLIAAWRSVALTLESERAALSGSRDPDIRGIHAPPTGG